MQKAKAKILIVEDDPQVALLLQDLLQNEGYQTAIAYTGQDAIRKTLDVQPHLIILDLNLPDVDGLDLCPQLRDIQPNVGILILTGRAEVEDRINGLRSGADDYLVKPFDPRELVARCEALLRRLQAPHNLYKFLDLELDVERRLVRRGGKEIPLTDREFRLLRVFLENPGQVIPRRKLHRAVWGNAEPNSNILDVYIRYLRHKLEAGGLPRLIYTVRGIGYILREPETSQPPKVPSESTVSQEPT